MSPTLVADASGDGRTIHVAAVDARVDPELLPHHVEIEHLDLDTWQRDGVTADVVVWNNNNPFPVGGMTRTKCGVFLNWGTNTANLGSVAEITAQATLETTQGYCTDTVARWAIDTAAVRRPLAEAVVGVIGMGRIGYSVARRVSIDHGAAVMYWAPTLRAGLEFEAVPLADLCRTAEIIVIAVNTDRPLDLAALAENPTAPVVINLSPDAVCPAATMAPLVEAGTVADFVSDNAVPAGSPTPEFYTGKVAYKSPEARATKHHILSRSLLALNPIDPVVLLARHGQTEWNRLGRRQGHLDSPLSSTGARQAEQLADMAGHHRITTVYSSPLKRAVTSAERVTATIGGRVEIRPEFIEMDFGDFQGQPESIIDHHPRYRGFRRIDPLYTPYPNGESYYDLYLRVLPTVIEIASQGERCMIVGHSSLNRMIRAVLTDTPPEDLARRRQPNDVLWAIDTAAKTTLATKLSTN